jgi:hypothetical protein
MWSSAHDWVGNGICSSSACILARRKNRCGAVAWKVASEPSRLRQKAFAQGSASDEAIDGLPVVAGLVSAIHVLSLYAKQDVDARDERGHDDCSP